MEEKDTTEWEVTQNLLSQPRVPMSDLQGEWFGIKTKWNKAAAAHLNPCRKLAAESTLLCDLVMKGREEEDTSATSARPLYEKTWTAASGHGNEAWRLVGVGGRQRGAEEGQTAPARWLSRVPAIRIRGFPGDVGKGRCWGSSHFIVGPHARDSQFPNAFPVRGRYEQGRVKPKTGTVQIWHLRLCDLGQVA